MRIRTTQLIVWGGVAKPTNNTTESLVGGIWTPPFDWEGNLGSTAMPTQP